MHRIALLALSALMCASTAVAADGKKGVLLALTGVAFGLHLIPRGETMRLFHAIHVGSWGGVLTKVITFVVSVIGGSLPLTGYYLYFKKRH